jgi:hypothetical protein
MASPDPIQPARPRLKQVASDTGPMAAPHLAFLEIGDRVYRISFWPDADWDRLPNVARPEVIRDVFNRGWFSLEAV